jgi:hypothetical protein
MREACFARKCASKPQAETAAHSKIIYLDL